MQELKGKTAIITGGASGIGLGIATAFAREGMNLVIADIVADRLDAAKRELDTLGARVTTVVTDVSDPASVAAAAHTVESTFGKLHVAVNNAGVPMHGKPIEQVSVEEWQRVLGVNVMGVINGIRCFVPMIRSHGEGGHVVNTASISGFFIRNGRNQGAYSMSKYAVVALSEALEQETEDANIGVSVLCPGPVHTNLLASISSGPATPAAMGNRLEPDAVGRRVVQAIRDREFYVLTHASERDVIKARHARIDAAFDRADAWQRS
jgi:NAD(P)-dependent dehydrogenase (short-subunit alcohol dehydrogenase family)